MFLLFFAMCFLLFFLGFYYDCSILPPYFYFVFVLGIFKVEGQWTMLMTQNQIKSKHKMEIKVCL